ncbi:hypothetical protein M0R45_036388 [Rubus argutus]|uniref:Retrotransposon gag domain-containing protein n=1 Tax=Rubus argutus TaxID=59490 RepID=A0AAW1VWW5_RUBAR
MNEVAELKKEKSQREKAEKEKLEKRKAEKERAKQDKSKNTISELEEAEKRKKSEANRNEKRKERNEDDDGYSSTETEVTKADNNHKAGGSEHSPTQTKKPKMLEWQIRLEKMLQAHTKSNQSPTEMAIEAVGSIDKSPFTKDIMQVKKPPKFTTPEFIKFEGKTDPVEHIHQYQQEMILESDDERLLFKLFPSSLAGAAHAWFRQLKPNSISSFTQLCQEFIAQYVCKRKKKKDMAALFGTKQQVGEKLGDFLERFIDEMAKLGECDTHYAAIAFREGLIPGGKMHQSLIKRPPQDMRDVLSRAEGKIRLEEEEKTQAKRTIASKNVEVLKVVPFDLFSPLSRNQPCQNKYSRV